MVPSAPLYSLKFNYDATTPLVNISLLVYPSPPPPLEEIDGKEAPSIVEEDPKTVYSGVHGGGFNQVFQLPSEAALDLSSAIAPAPSNGNDSNAALNERDEKNIGNTTRGSQSEDTNRSSLDNSMAQLHVAQPDLPTVPEVSQPPNEPSQERRPRRFGLFPRRGNRETDLEAGQIELQNRQTEENKEEEHKTKEPEMGMRLLIRIEAVGPEGALWNTLLRESGSQAGQALKRRNAQLTHILVTGMWVPDAGSTGPPGQGGKRVWVVKVVRREAEVRHFGRIRGLRLTPDRRSHVPAQGDLWSFVFDADPVLFIPANWWR